MKRIIFLLAIILSFNIKPLFSFTHFDDNVSELLKSAKEHMYQNPAEAIKYAVSAKDKAQEIQDTSLIFDAKVILAASYTSNGNFDLALDTYINAEIFLNQNNPLRVADYNINMASMYFNLNNTYKSHRYNDLALNAYYQYNDSVSIGWALNLRGLIYIEEKNYGNAKTALELALEISQQINNEEAIYVIINNMALIPGDEDEKIKDIIKAVEYNKSKNNKWSLAENYNNLGLLHYRKNNLDTAKDYLKKARNIADSLNANIVIRDNLKYFTDIAVKENKYKDAYEIFLEIAKIDEIINSIDKIKQIEEQANEKKRLIQLYNLQKKEAELQKATHEKTVITFYSILFLIILSIAIRIYHIRRVNRLKLKNELEIKKKEILKRELEDKENEINAKEEILNISRQEMTNLVYFIKSKDKLLDNIILGLKEVQRKPEDEVKARIKTTIASIKSFKEKEIKTNLFITEINKTESQFLDRLKQNFPDLSKNEIELATLLRIGLSSKEIALLLDSNPKTVNMARYRLRKKMNLENDESLAGYFEML